jgi:WD40 repeat protein
MAGGGADLVAGLTPKLNMTIPIRATAVDPAGKSLVAVSGMTGDNENQVWAFDLDRPRDPPRRAKWPLPVSVDAIRLAFARGWTAAGPPSVSIAPKAGIVAVADGRDIALVKLTDMGRPPVPVRGHAARVTAVAFRPVADGDRLTLASADDAGEVRVGTIDRSGYRLERAIAPPAAPSAAAVPAAGGDSTGTGGATNGAGTGAGNGIVALAWSADGKALAVASEAGVVRVFDPPTAATSARTLTAPKPVLSLAWSADGRSVAVGCEDGRVRVWGADEAAARVLETGRPGVPRAVAFDPTGQFLVAGVGANLRSGDVVGAGFLDARSPELTSSLAVGGAVVFIDLRPGRAGQPPAAYADALPAVSTLTLLPDGLRVAAGCDDRSIRFTAASPVRLVEAARQRVKRRLTPAEWDTYVGKDLPYE